MSTTALKKMAGDLAKLSKSVNKTLAAHLSIKKKKAKKPAKKAKR